MAAKKKTGATRKPARGRPASRSQKPATPFRIVLATAMNGMVNMAVVAIVAATVLGGLLAAKHLGV